ncbi:uncharacterized protein LOC106646815 [Copidosoma floridanum]|uniref:uncharacterized protein LOC106646815 n=1 Tax=Copidosoma floridanum TaxID=29053 RepID=UPI0006C97C14|nr:uncharacterized protein LOC106646815 [Copidosoma floridanum]
MNEMLSREGPVTPCVQLIVCSAVAVARHSDNQSSADKIIDGLSSHSWFEQVTNGTSIEEAISMGRKVSETEECNVSYKNCALNRQIVNNLLKLVGL